jgi:hypothetical protein
VSVAAVAVLYLLLHGVGEQKNQTRFVSHTCMINISSGSDWTSRNKEVAMVAKKPLTGYTS